MENMSKKINEHINYYNKEMIEINRSLKHIEDYGNNSYLDRRVVKEHKFYVMFKNVQFINSLLENKEMINLDSKDILLKNLINFEYKKEDSLDFNNFISNLPLSYNGGYSLYYFKNDDVKVMKNVDFENHNKNIQILTNFLLLNNDINNQMKKISSENVLKTDSFKL